MLAATRALSNRRGRNVSALPRCAKWSAKCSAGFAYAACSWKLDSGRAWSALDGVRGGTLEKSVPSLLLVPAGDPCVCPALRRLFAWTSLICSWCCPSWYLSRQSSSLLCCCWRLQTVAVAQKLVSRRACSAQEREHSRLLSREFRSGLVCCCWLMPCCQTHTERTSIWVFCQRLHK